MTTRSCRLIVERGGEQGILEAEEEQMIHAVIELGDQRIHEVMVPRIAIVALPADATLEEAIDTVVEEGHSRIPVYEETIDEIIGILYAKDLLPFLKASAARAAGAPVDPADAGLRARVDERRRPAPRVPAAQGPHRDRPRRVRRDGRPGHHRGPARGDRRRDPGRVRRGGADDRPAVRRRGPDRRPGRRRRPGRAVRHRTSGSRTRTSTTRSAGSSTTGSAASRSPATRSRSTA